MKNTVATTARKLVLDEMQNIANDAGEIFQLQNELSYVMQKPWASIFGLNDIVVCNRRLQIISVENKAEHHKLVVPSFIYMGRFSPDYYVFVSEEKILGYISFEIFHKTSRVTPGGIMYVCERDLLDLSLLYEEFNLQLFTGPRTDEYEEGCTPTPQTELLTYLKDRADSGEMFSLAELEDEDLWSLIEYEPMAEMFARLFPTLVV